MLYRESACLIRSLYKCDKKTSISCPPGNLKHLHPEVSPSHTIDIGIHNVLRSSHFVPIKVDSRLRSKPYSSPVSVCLFLNSHFKFKLIYRPLCKSLPKHARQKPYHRHFLNTPDVVRCNIFLKYAFCVHNGLLKALCQTNSPYHLI
jgi:hypothetical protein